MSKQTIKEQPRIWFTSDLHFSHKNILKHQQKRISAMGLKDEGDIAGHDEYLKNMWLNTVKRGDHVYVLGDMIMTNKDASIKLLHTLKSKGCCISLIVGNHDSSIKNLTNMFESIDLIKVVTFKKSVYSFLDNDFTCVLCHYPMKSWPHKAYGAPNLFGHVHDNHPWIDAETDDLCLNVGVDTPFANYQLISLEQVYDWYKKKLNGQTPSEYIETITNNNPKFIR